MTKQERIELLQSQVQHNRIKIAELDSECRKYDIDLYEEVLFPIGYNTCDRCGDYGDSELDFLWVDGFDWDENNVDDQTILKNMAKEKADYCALCWDCVEKLKKGGRV